MRTTLLAAFVGVAAFGSGSSAFGQLNFWWDPAGVSPATGGSGVWDALSPDWLTPAINSPLPAVPWVNGNIANFSGTAGTVTVGAPITADQINFNTTGYTIAASGGNTLTLGGATPTIDAGSGTANTFLSTISANISAANPVNIVDTFTGTGNTPNNILNLTGTTSFASGTLTITSSSVASELFNVAIPQPLTLSTLNFSTPAANNTYLIGTVTLAGALPTGTLGTLNLTGTTPTITFGAPSGPKSGGAFIYDNISATNQVQLIANTALGQTPVLNFAGTSNSFGGGLLLTDNLPQNGAGSWTTTTGGVASGQHAVARFNFNTPNAGGGSGAASEIDVAANGLIITDTGGAPGFTLNLANDIHLNSNGVVPDSGFFITAIGATKASTGATHINYSGRMYGDGSVLIGNDLVRGSGGAGMTIFSGTPKTFTGKVVYNGTYNTSTHAIAVLLMGAKNVLPTDSTFALQFGFSDGEAAGSEQNNNLGSVDLNGYSQTIASLTSSVTLNSKINGITTSYNGPTTATQDAIPTLTINGSSNDWYTGGLGTAQNFGPLYPNLPVAYNKVALTRTGTGGTTLGASPNGTNNGNSSDYVGDTKVEQAASLIAGSVTAFSPNSNFIVNDDGGNAALDLNGYSDTINSLAGTGTVRNNLNQVNYNGSGLQYTTNGGAAGHSAVLTIGSTGSVNANPSPTTTFSGVISDGGGGLGSAGTLGIIMGGNGTQILAGTNTYTGPTTINAGTLSLASTGSLAAGSAVTINGGGTLAGSGTANGPVTVNPSGRIAPGAATTPGALTVGSLTFTGGGVYGWKINDATAASGTGYDTINSAGSLTLDGTVSASSTVNIKLTSLAGAVPGTPAHFVNTSPFTWALGTFSSLAGTPFASNLFNVDATGFKGGNLFSTFNVTNPGPGVLDLVYTPGTPPPTLFWSNGGAGGFGAWAPSGGMAWNNGSSNGPWSSAAGADFNIGSGTVTLSGAISAPLITFDVDGYTIAGGGNALSATSGFSSLTVQVTNAGTTGTIGGSITSPLQVIGNGTLVLTGNNSFGGGDVTVSGGTLQGNISSLGGNGGTTSNTSITNNTTVVFDQATDATYAGTMSGSGVFVKQNAGTLTLSGTNSYGGGTTIKAGALSISDNSNLGSSSGGVTFDGGTLRTTLASSLSITRPITVTANGGTLTDVAQAVNLFSGGATIAGGATFTKNGPGTLQILSAGWSGSGTIVINQGSLVVGNETDLNSNPSSFLGNNSLTLNTGTTMEIAAGTDAGGSLAIPGLTLNGNVTFSLYKTGGNSGLGPLNASVVAPTVISGGTIHVGGVISSSLAQSSLFSFGAVTLNGDTTIQTDSNSTDQTGVSFTGILTDNGHTMTFLGQGNSSIQQTPGAGVSIGGASNGAPTITGNWIIGDAAGTNAQIVAVNAQGALNPSNSFTTGNVTVNTGSQLFFEPRLATYGATSGVQNLTVSGQGPFIPNAVGNDVFDGSIKLLGDAKVNLTANIHTTFASPVLLQLQSGSAVQLTKLTFNGPVSGSFPLTIHADDFASVVFNGVNNLTGSTIMTGGELDVNAGSSMGTGDLTMNQHKGRNTAVALSNAAQSIGNLSSIYDGSNTPVFQTITLNGTVLSIHQTLAADYGDNLADGATAMGSDSIITGSGSIVLAVGSTAELSLSSPNNSYTGSTTINAGSLAISTDSNLGMAPTSSTPGQLTVNGGQFHATGGGPLVLAPTRGFTAGPDGGTLLTDAGTPLTIQGITTFSNAAATLNIAAGSYVKLNASTNAASVTPGSSITVASGATLELAGSASALSDGSTQHNVNVVNNSAAAGGGLRVSGTHQKVGAISGSGNTVIDAGSDLTANSVQQTSLVIGGTAGSPALVTIRASDNNGNPLADTASGGSGLALAGSIATSEPFAAGIDGGSKLIIRGATATSASASALLPGGGVNFGGELTAVPEPSSILLAALAAFSFAGVGWRRNRRSRQVI
ncbi:MAG TPA: autotransporter-associated beta strand repeat-containing protein [Pirellulales bacterium]|nr:autotransporter-associated beta strand repeat-containing protein [Pirellulales bacterium]